MHIFFLNQAEKAGRDETQSMVVIARDEEHARELASASRHELSEPRSNGFGDEGSKIWQSPAVICHNIGNADAGSTEGVICTAYFHT